MLVPTLESWSLKEVVVSVVIQVIRLLTTGLPPRPGWRG